MAGGAFAQTGAGCENNGYYEDLLNAGRCGEAWLAGPSEIPTVGWLGCMRPTRWSGTSVPAIPAPTGREPDYKGPRGECRRPSGPVGLVLDVRRSLRRRLDPDGERRAGRSRLREPGRGSGQCRCLRPSFGVHLNFGVGDIDSTSWRTSSSGESRLRSGCRGVHHQRSGAQSELVAASGATATEGRDLRYDYLREVVEADVDGDQPAMQIAARLKPYRDRVFFEALKRVDEWCRQRDLPLVFLVVAQPSPTDTFNRRFAEVRDRVAELGRPIVDITDAFDDVARPESLWIRPWDRHPTAAGHALMANRLGDAIGSDDVAAEALLGPVLENTNGDAHGPGRP